MLINSFSVENFRSISNAKIPLYNYSILIGPNNQGKSNILRGLAMALYIIDDYLTYSPGHRSRMLNMSRFNTSSTKYRRDDDLEYSYKRDYPLNLQSNDVKKEGKSKFTVTFQMMTEKEKTSFHKHVGQNIIGDLKIEIILGQRTIDIIAKDTRKPKPLRSLDVILEFILNNIQLTYIEAIRDSARTMQIVEEMVADELASLESKRKYNDLMKQVEEMQRPLLNSLSDALTKSVSEFLPEVTKIHLDSKERIRRIARLATTLHVDDGNNTTLDLKGDGIKSLIAISILQHATKQHARKKKIILAVEEPESHLHPDAIHKLRRVLEEISIKNQVIISSHSPLLVNRSEISRNVIVDQSQAIAAKSISQIRNILGVQIADNLTSANLVILTEGKDDADKIKTWACELSSMIKKAISDGTIIFDDLGGSSKLLFKAALWKNMLCDVHVFLDNDTAGQQAFKEAFSKASISLDNVTFATLNGMHESELEDLILSDMYKDEIKKLGVDLDASKEFKNRKKKWTERMRDTFKEQGKPWNDIIETTVKNLVTNKAIDVGIKCIHKQNQQPIRKFVSDLEEYLEKKSASQKTMIQMLSK